MSNTYKYINEQGIIVPDTQDVLVDVQNEWKLIFGQDLPIEEGTPQGRIIELIATERKQLINTVAYIANQINPDIATSSFLDAQGSFFGVERIGSRNTIVYNVKMTGVPFSNASGKITIKDYTLISESDSLIIGEDVYDIKQGTNNDNTAYLIATAINNNSEGLMIATASGNVVTLSQKSNVEVPYHTQFSLSLTNSEAIEATGDGYLTGGSVTIPQGTIASDVYNNYYILSESKVLDDSGIAYGNFVSEKNGAVICPPHTLTNCSINPIEGWETIDNSSAGNIGYDKEPDSQYRKRINLSKSKYSTSMSESLISELYEIEGLTSCYVYENFENYTKTNEDDSVIPVGESIEGHSIFVVVNGSNKTEDFYNKVAEAIIRKKSGGCGLIHTKVYPSNQKTINVRNGLEIYPIKFNIPQYIPIYITLSVKGETYSDNYIIRNVQSILSDYFSSNIEGLNKINIGSNISAFDIGNVVSQKLGFYIVNCFISKSPNPTSSQEIPIGFNEIATVDPINIKVNII